MFGVIGLTQKKYKEREPIFSSKYDHTGRGWENTWKPVKTSNRLEKNDKKLFNLILKDVLSFFDKNAHNEGGAEKGNWKTSKKDRRSELPKHNELPMAAPTEFQKNMIRKRVAFTKSAINISDKILDWCIEFTQGIKVPFFGYPFDIREAVEAEKKRLAKEGEYYRRLAETDATLFWVPLFFALLLFSYFVWRRFKTLGEPRVSNEHDDVLHVPEDQL